MQQHKGVNRFYTVEETRYYTAYQASNVLISDAVSVSSVATDDDGDRTYSQVWATKDYDLLPYNAANRGEPYRELEVAVNGDYGFPLSRRGVKVTGEFGYCAIANVPSQIREACLLIAHRTWMRKDAIFGVAGNAAMGTVTVIAKVMTDADVMAKLDSIPKRWA